MFLETYPKMKDAFKTYFESGYRQLYLTEMLNNIDKTIDLLQNCEISTYKGRSTLCIEFVYRKCSYVTRCRFKHATGIDITDKYTAEMSIFTKS